MKSKFLIFLFLISFYCTIDAKEALVLDHSDNFEVQHIDNYYVTYVTGNVHFKTETGDIYCDSARWIRGEAVRLNGNVIVDESKYHILADSVFYNMTTEEYLVLGQKVELWSYVDSVFAVGTHAFFDKNGESFYMEDRPLMYLNYPDTSSMFEILADKIDYNLSNNEAEAFGDVIITSDIFSSHSNCAKIDSTGNVLDLFDKPSIKKGESTVSGELITLYMYENKIDYIDVIDSARAEFKEPTDTTNSFFDESILSGNRIIMHFEYGLMDNIICYGQAYSWYYPYSSIRNEFYENSVSGDTIKFFIENDELQTIDVIGGAQGQYLSGKNKLVDSVVVQVVDTIDYKSHFIEYALTDSLITLKEKANVKSGQVALDAHFIEFDTDKNIIEAFSADIEADTVINPYYLSRKIQPNVIPVILKDGDEEIFGDYLLYSIATEKGRIIQTKTDFTQGIYYGSKLYREQKEIYYVHDGRYTTCDAQEPHYHFKSSNMKMIEGKRLIAKPVVFFIETIPVLALPYYIFPLEKGRHSGLLPFSFGQFEKGDRYVSNVGYYWATSEYMDIKSSFDYYEQRHSIKYNSKVTFNKRYVLNGFLEGNYVRTTNYDRLIGDEVKSVNWTLNGSYNHTFSPDFNLSATGRYVNDKNYASLYSQNIDERQDRSLRSTLAISKKFGKSVRLSGNLEHVVNLDDDSRRDVLPSLSLYLPTLYPFGSASRNSEGELKSKFYNDIYITYGPSLAHYSNKSVLDQIDTTSVLDTNMVDTLFSIDTTSYSTRKRYAVIRHSPTLHLPSLKLGYFLNLSPSVGYSETWVKIYETDQSIDAGIDASKLYRSYSYSANLSANTTLYGTISPKLFGLQAIRHVITPSASFSYSPEIHNDELIRQYSGVGSSSSRRRQLSFTVGNLFQAKIKKGEEEKALDIVKFTSSFTYDLEVDDRPLSNMTTRFNSSALPIFNSFSGSMTHTFYNLTDSTEQLFSPQLLSFSLTAGFNISGDKFFFDDDYEIPKGKDTKEEINGENITSSRWSLSGTYNYSETGIGSSNWRKSSFVTLNLNFNLTPSTAVSYSQRYDIAGKFTINNSVQINRKIHCWTGSLHWVPNGTNAGFGFTLYVTKQPEIKLDNNYSSFSSTTFNR